jgi:hypothetical protein
MRVEASLKAALPKASAPDLQSARWPAALIAAHTHTAVTLKA